MDNGSLRHRHGVAFIVDFNCQMLGVWVQGFHLLNMYALPGQQTVGMQMFAEHAASFHMGRNWATMGDFNRTPIEDCAALFASHGGLFVGPPNGAPTRCAAAQTMVPNLCAYKCMQEDIVLSDHKGCWYEVHRRDMDLRKGRLKPAARWKKLEALDSETWMQAFEVPWKEQAAQHQVFLRLQQDFQNQRENNQQSVQSQWEDFMTCLNVCFAKAVHSLLRTQTDPEVLRALQALNRQPRPAAKGRVAAHQWVTDAGLAKANPAPGEKGRKLRRQLARCYEAQRLFKDRKVLDRKLFCRVFLAIGKQGRRIEVPC